MTGRRFLKNVTTDVTPGRNFTDLPEEVILLILSYLDVRSLCRFTMVNKHIQSVCQQDYVWKKFSEKLTVCRPAETEGGDNRGAVIFDNLSVNDQCRIASNWENGHASMSTLLRYSDRQIPCLSRDGPYLWTSHRGKICCFRQQPNGSLREITRRRLMGGHKADVSKFTSKYDMVVCGCRDGSISCWNGITGNRVFHRPANQGHRDDVSCVDIRDTTIVTGSRDKTVKIWSWNCHLSDSLRQTIQTNDRMWSIAISNDGSFFAGGTGGHNPTPALRTWDLTTGKLNLILSSPEYRNGAGVLDLHFETPHILWSCGYDSCIRVWDIRTGDCVDTWEDPYDTTVYCMQPCGQYGLLSGTSMYGVVRLWDKRQTKSVQMYYTMPTRRDSSPVYSMLCDRRHLIVALDRCIRLVNFDIHGGHGNNKYQTIAF